MKPARTLLTNIVFGNLGLKWLVAGTVLIGQLSFLGPGTMNAALADTVVDETNSSVARPQVLSESGAQGSNVSVAASGHAVFDLSSSGVLNIAGDLLNAGTIYAISTNPNITTGTINASNISIAPGASLTSILPTGGLVGFSNALQNFSFILNATGTISNAGTIASANNLSLFAGDSVINSGTITALGNLNVSAGSSISNIMNSAALAGVMQAVNNLSLTAPSIINNSLITANTGNMNLITDLLQNSGSVQSKLMVPVTAMVEWFTFMEAPWP